MNHASTCITTIVSANYLAYARVLGQSVAERLPSATFTVLIVDRATQAVRDAVEESGLQVVYANELPLADLEQIAYKYDILELNTALKPTFLKMMAGRGFEKVIYFDPDIRLFDHPSDVLSALDTQAIVLTPHALSPVMDGSRPSDVDFLRAGVFNLGFVGIRASADGLAFLDWWEDRCLSYGFSDTSFGTFVDQKWINLVPTYFPSHSVLRHPGCNAAYWNLHERTLSTRAGAYFCNDQPLVFFHFSGVSATKPDVLSKHQNRHVIQPGTPIQAMVSDYCSRLLSAGHRRFASLSYTFGVLSDGTPITATMRRAYAYQDAGAGNPFDAGSPFQARLRASGIAPRPQAGGAGPSKAGVTTMNFNGEDRRILWANRAVRFVAKLMGTDRCKLLFDYIAYLTRESNYAGVLLAKAPDLRHMDKRERSTARDRMPERSVVE